jgi:quinohemoprotein ethanol dehydrogenase
VPPYPSTLKTKILFILFLCFLSGCEKPKSPAGWIDKERLLKADNDPLNWISLGGNFKQQHYSPLANITAENVSTLGLAWSYDARSRRGRVQRGLEATPIVVDGTLYTSGAWGVVYALDAKTGKEIWRYDPDIDGNYARRACCDVVNRGVQVWRGKVYVGVLDGYLVCLDAATGKVIWKIDTITDRERFYTITGPPQIANNVVVIGNSGGEFGVRGYITAYDLETGKQAWRFFMVPGDPKKGFEHPELEEAAKTWDADSYWDAGLGGTSWGELTYDPELNLLYVGTGNSSPYPIWFRSPSGGDNLFLASILAINPDTGRLVWHYQTTPGEIWDFTATSNMVLAELEIEGRLRKVLMQAPKNGFFYVLDRQTGEFISAEKFVPVNWASHIDKITGRPVLTGEGWYKEKSKLVYPAMAGGHSWQPMSYNPNTKLVYIPAMHLPMVYTSQKEFKYSRDDNTGVRGTPDDLFSAGDGIKSEAFLLAWDPVLQKERWRVKMNVVDFNGGVLSTAGNLVFQGTTDGYFVIYRADTGEKIKEIKTGIGIMAAPSTYGIDGEQFVAVMAGFGGATLPFLPERAAAYEYENNGTILAYKLGGTDTPLPPVVTKTAVPRPPDKVFSNAQIKQGESIYKSVCIFCHGGFGPKHISLYPDLAKMSENTHEQFNSIVLKGTLSTYGMASFADIIDETKADAIHQYLIQQQQKLFADSLTNVVNR